VQLAEHWPLSFKADRVTVRLWRPARYTA
jgi:hypothetical protein